MTIPIRAILVSVNYHDLLSITLPYNKHHFDDVLVVTTPSDLATQSVAHKNQVSIFCTDSFYDNGASFNKWKALEEGLDHFGRNEWLCIMDADILWPKVLPPIKWERNKLYTPLRRMCEKPTKDLIPEHLWPTYPTHKQVREWAGYTQIFHADDCCLGTPPWHEINWTHAGGADSFFQRKWKPKNKIRPDFEVLHLGPAGSNWFGRSTNYLDGTKPETAQQSILFLQEMRRNRRTYRNFNCEKI